jgi:hypothetical protein
MAAVPFGNIRLPTILSLDAVIGVEILVIEQVIVVGVAVAVTHKRDSFSSLQNRIAVISMAVT